MSSRYVSVLVVSVLLICCESTLYVLCCCEFALVFEILLFIVTCD